MVDLSYFTPLNLLFVGLLAMVFTSKYLKRRFNQDGPGANLAMTPCLLGLFVGSVLVGSACLAAMDLLGSRDLQTLTSFVLPLGLVAPAFSGRFDVLKRVGKDNDDRIQRKWDEFLDGLATLDTNIRSLNQDQSSKVDAIREFLHSHRHQQVEKPRVVDILIQLNTLNGMVDIATVTLPVILSKSSAEDGKSAAAPTLDAIERDLTALHESLANLFNDSNQHGDKEA